MFASAEFVLEGRRAFFRTYPKIETFDDLGCYEEREWGHRTHPESFVSWIFIRKISIRNLKTSTLQFNRLHTEVKLDKLHSLDFIDTFDINMDISGIEDIHLLCSSLQSFTMSRESRRPLGKYTQHLSKLTNLRSLKLQGSQDISDVEMNFLSMGCKLLENLDLSFFRKITVRTIKHLAKNCRQLKSLYLTNCFEKFEYASLQQLFDFCRFRIDEGWGFPMLTDLDLSGNHLYDVWLHVPVSHNYFPSLTSLNLDRCVGLTYSSLQYLSSHCLIRLKLITSKRLGSLFYA